MRTIRRILLTEYIGAILVAVLVADAFFALITTAVGQISLRVELTRNPMLQAHRPSMTFSLLEALCRIALYLVSAYLLARWLYPAKPTELPKAAERVGAEGAK
jgi:hypothetical protein